MVKNEVWSIAKGVIRGQFQTLATGYERIGEVRLLLTDCKAKMKMDLMPELFFLISPENTLKSVGTAGNSALRVPFKCLTMDLGAYL